MPENIYFEYQHLYLGEQIFMSMSFGMCEILILMPEMSLACLKTYILTTSTYI